MRVTLDSVSLRDPASINLGACPDQVALLFECLRVRGVALDGVLHGELEAFGAPPVEPPAKAVPVLLDRLWETAAFAARDEAFGLHAACDVLREIATGNRRQRWSLARALLTPTEYVSCFRGERLHVTLLQPRSHGEQRQRTEFALALLGSLCRETLLPEGAIQRLWLSYPAPQNMEPYTCMFGVTPEFGAADCCFTLALEGAPLEDAVPETTTPRTAETVRGLERLLTSEAHAQAPSLAQAARELGVTPRTLQRRLRAEATTYRAVLERALSERAVLLLSEQRLPITAVAEQLGFSEPRAFHRAFKRWTGRGPGEFSRGSPRASIATLLNSAR